MYADELRLSNLYFGESLETAKIIYLLKKTQLYSIKIIIIQITHQIL